MTAAFLSCPSCRKLNKTEGRYCIGCGSILKPVFCSSCGTVNPEGLAQCVECGKTMPSLAGVRWNPIVTILQPTSGMSNEAKETIEAESAREQSVHRPSIQRFLRLGRKNKKADAH